MVSRFPRTLRIQLNALTTLRNLKEEFKTQSSQVKRLFLMKKKISFLQIKWKRLILKKIISPKTKKKKASLSKFFHKIHKSKPTKAYL